MLALVIFALDQFTKWLVLRNLPVPATRTSSFPASSISSIGTTPARRGACSAATTARLAVVALLAFVALFLTRHHFESHTLSGQIAFGLIFGGIAGNLTDRLLPSRHAVVDFIYFYLHSAAAAKSAFPPSTSPTPPSAPASA